MSVLLGKLTEATDLAKRLIQLTTIKRDVEAQEMIADLSLRLSELKVQAAALIEENQELRDQIATATRPPQLQPGPDGLYRSSTDDGPFCPTCFDSEGKAIRLSKMSRHFAAIGKWRCGVCKSHYQ